MNSENKLLLFGLLVILLFLAWFFICMGNYQDPTQKVKNMAKNGQYHYLEISDPEDFDFPVYVINLESQTSRWERMESELNKVGIQNVRKWKGVDGRIASDQELYDYDISKAFMARCNRGEAGCAASHRSLWKHIAENNMGWTLILEDDVSIHPEFKKLFAEYWNQTPANAYFVYVGYDDRMMNTRKKDPVISCGTTCTHAYMVDARGARYLLDNFPVFDRAFDEHIMFHFRERENNNKAFIFNGEATVAGIRPHEYKDKNGDKCMFGGIVYQNRQEVKSLLR